MYVPRSCNSRNDSFELILEQVPRKLYTFRNDPQYVREDMFFNESTTLHTLHNWIPFSSASRGYVVLKEDTKPYDLPKPYTVAIDRNSDGPGYMSRCYGPIMVINRFANRIFLFGSIRIPSITLSIVSCRTLSTRIRWDRFRGGSCAPLCSLFQLHPSRHYVCGRYDLRRRDYGRPG